MTTELKPGDVERIFLLSTFNTWTNLFSLRWWDENTKGKHMNEYSPIRIFQCGFLKCSKTTEDWFKEGWGITGLHDNMSPNLGGTTTIPREPFEETNFARRLLEHGKKIRATDLAAVLLCPEHKEILSQAQSLREANP